MRLLLVAALFTILSTATARAEIQDNSFFIEEAYNQDPKVVQTMATVLWTQEREEGDFVDDAITYSFTQEWPLGGQRHQLSYTFAFAHLYGDHGDAEGIEDVQINYRYQLMKESDGHPAIAPRFTMILPTGNSDEGLGAGTVGFQTNLPISKQLEGLSIHVNAGATFLPGVKVPLAAGGQSQPQDLFLTNFGFSVIPVISDRFNLMFETAAYMNEEIDDVGERERITRVLVSPGARFAIDRKDGGQWVIGAAAPIGVSGMDNDVGALLYLSFENHF